MHPAAIVRFPVRLALVALLFLARASLGASLPTYPEAMIREWTPEFRAVVQENYVRLFRPKLEDKEAEKLRKLRFEFPSDPARVLFDFRSREDGAVVLPVAALLLLKDLAAAHVWLEANGYSTQPVLDYLAIVRQGRLSNWPAAQRLPLKALGIPDGAIKSGPLLEKRNDILSKTLFFIMGHELGHLIQDFSAQAECRQRAKRKEGCNFKALQASEAQADAFAIDLFRRMGLVPSASNFFFALHSRLVPMPFEFPDSRTWQAHAANETHPLDSGRIRQAAELIHAQRDGFARGFAVPAAGATKVDFAVIKLRELADALDDRDLSGLQIAWAKSLAPEDIKPRRSVEPKLRPTPKDLASEQAWTGFFVGDAQFKGAGSLPLELVMRNGAGGRMTGEVMMAGIRGRVEGRYENASRANATWTVAGDSYRLTLERGAASGDMNASYKSTTDSASGRWKLRRSRTAAP